MRANTRDALLAGYGALPQNNNNPVDLGYPQNMTLAGLGGLEQVRHQPSSLISKLSLFPPS